MAASTDQFCQLQSLLLGSLGSVDADTIVTGTSEDFADPNGSVSTGDLLGLGYEGFALGGFRDDDAETEVGAICVFYGP